MAGGAATSFVDSLDDFLSTTLFVVAVAVLFITVLFELTGNSKSLDEGMGAAGASNGLFANMNGAVVDGDVVVVVLEVNGEIGEKTKGDESALPALVEAASAFFVGVSGVKLKDDAIVKDGAFDDGVADDVAVAVIGVNVNDEPSVGELFCAVAVLVVPVDVRRVSFVPIENDAI